MKCERLVRKPFDEVSRVDEIEPAGKIFLRHVVTEDPQCRIPRRGQLEEVGLEVCRQDRPVRRDLLREPTRDSAPARPDLQAAEPRPDPQAKKMLASAGVEHDLEPLQPRTFLVPAMFVGVALTHGMACRSLVRMNSPTTSR